MSDYISGQSINGGGSMGNSTYNKANSLSNYDLIPVNEEQKRTYIAAGGSFL